MGADRVVLAALVVLPSVLTLAMVVVNRWTWRRPVPLAEAPRAAVSVLVPARNEAPRLPALVGSILAGSSGGDDQLDELIICDDGSTDGSDAVLAALAARHPQMRVLTGAPLPPGWVGKPHACHQLAAAATNDLLLFVDADVQLRAGAVAALVHELHRDHGADVVTAVPRQAMPTWAEGLMMPLLHLSYTAWLPLALIPAVADPRVLAANGQVLLVRRDALDAIGGWASVRGEVVDDMALCRRVKKAGRRVCFVDGALIADCRMYDGLPSLVAGFSKNLY
ncbi:MAG: glycosyltransferase, partial [Deltaproteobacteria bacterium]